MGGGKSSKPTIIAPPPPPPPQNPSNSMEEIMPVMMQMMEMMGSMATAMSRMHMPSIPQPPAPTEITPPDWEQKRKELEEEIKRNTIERHKKGVYSTILTDQEDWNLAEDYPVLLSVLRKAG